MDVQQQVIRTTAINQALTRLSPQQRQAVVLHYYGGLTYQEVAILMGLQYRQVKRLIHTALCVIRESWGIRLPERSEQSADAWWPLLLESLYRHAKGSKFTALGGEVFASRPDCGVDSTAGTEGRQ